MAADREIRRKMPKINSPDSDSEEDVLKQPKQDIVPEVYVSPNECVLNISNVPCSNSYYPSDGSDVSEDESVIYSDSDDSDSAKLFSEGLAKWISQSTVSQADSDKLLLFLKSNGHPELPLTTRTLLGTKRSVELRNVSDMDFCNLVLSQQLSNNLNCYSRSDLLVVDTLELTLNIDGINLFKSSNKSLWPVLCMISNLKPRTVFPIVVCYGSSKPKNLDFLECIISELKCMTENGFHFENDLTRKHFRIHLQAVVCDAQAKALVKGIKQFSGYYGCDKCSQKGKWIGRMTFPVTDPPLRTNETFRNMQNDEHHNGTTPFLELPIDMIDNFPIDYMHQVCLGVQRKLLLTWMRGKLSVRIPSSDIMRISERLISFRKNIPRDVFARKPRGLLDIDRWKATEFRQFLLYTGKLILKGILRNDIYNHFLLFSSAMCILVCPRLIVDHSDVAHRLLLEFVSHCPTIYGEEFLVYNVHSLIHLTSDALRYGGLDSCAAFPFENYLQQLKRKVKSARNPVAQIVKRIHENQQHACPNGKRLTRKISTKEPNNVYKLDESRFCQVVEKADGPGNFICRVFHRTKALFENPIDSRLFGVATACIRHSRMEVIRMESLSKRAICFTKDNENIHFMSILHDIE